MNTLLLLAIALVYAIGIAGHLVPSLAPLVVSTTPAVLALCGLSVLGVSAREYRRLEPGAGARLITWTIAAYAATFIIETVGVASGAVFGAYRYGTVLGPTLFSVPLVIGFNWVLVLLGASRLALRFGLGPLSTSLLAALFSVLFDLVLEPVAVHLGYWRWSQTNSPSVSVAFAAPPSVAGGVPLKNYGAWFAIAFAGALLYNLFVVGADERRSGPRVRRQPDLPAAYVTIQFLFFLIVVGGLLK